MNAKIAKCFKIVRGEIPDTWALFVDTDAFPWATRRGGVKVEPVTYVADGETREVKNCKWVSVTMFINSDQVDIPEEYYQERGSQVSTDVDED